MQLADMIFEYQSVIYLLLLADLWSYLLIWLMQHFYLCIRFFFLALFFSVFSQKLSNVAVVVCVVIIVYSIMSRSKGSSDHLSMAATNLQLSCPCILKVVGKNYPGLNFYSIHSCWVSVKNIYIFNSMRCTSIGHNWLTVDTVAKVNFRNEYYCQALLCLGIFTETLDLL